ncbi:DNA cytosine methyltransferase [Zavarzinella formosa]|uniref:DNA cytosine methyltransferase n=1 Tax=Zavarzinella formosa TaxID=360055 RepID=UPI000376CEE1|nr:DNA cytosine methyltransferase [Zavarzinella formosa]
MNEFDASAAEWARELIRAGELPPGEVDERSIKEVRPKDLEGFTQCHFFAGIGGWPLALRLAGWPESVPVWTGSCPCQPYSAAGKGKGDADERNLWPEMFRLIRECRPDTIFGEQVENAVGHGWLDGISADLEGEGYAVGSCVLGAHSVGSPHIRQRLYWVAHARDAKRNWWREPQCGPEQLLHASNRSGTCGMADAGSLPSRYVGRSDGEGSAEWQEEANQLARCCGDGGLEHATGDGRQQRRPESDRGGIASGCGFGGLGESFQSGLEGLTGDGHDGREPGRINPDEVGPIAPAGANGGMALSESREQRRAWECREGERSGELSAGRHGGGFWDTFDLIPCRDGKARRIEPGSFPLAHGIPGRVGLLRGYGNAIVPQVAAVFIRAFIEANLINQGVAAS